MGTFVTVKCDNCGYTKEKIFYPGQDRGFVVMREAMP